ncbi:MAG TPA: dihydroorotate dehydrogenase electron transfer subunit [Candidatus Omnitrophota bacterium]|nr:dihydroorotate dehydrogenase electron transfer subunit [Candidatus Omnitrophota bacterium]
MVQINSRIINNKRFKGHYWHCIFEAPLIAKIAIPGQFIDIKLSRNLEPFLRRPFSIHNISGNKVEILYEVLGIGTKILSAGKKGEYLDIIGPLGNGFTYQNQANSPAQKTIIVAGGIGAAPLLYLSRKIKAENKIVLIGARTKEQVLCEKEFKESGCFVKIATDDGSAGFKGRVSGLLKLVLKREDSKSTVIYACGPKPMLKAVAEIAGDKNIPAQVSMEEHMSCGIGACLGCVVKTKKGLERVCKEGPVFDAQYLIW